MRILELFSGTGSLAKVARAQGHEVVTLDICPRHNPTICVSILEWDPSVPKLRYHAYSTTAECAKLSAECAKLNIYARPPE